MAFENIKLSQKERDGLMKLKRTTGIKNWNTLCRWAFCVSLAEPSKPRKVKITSDSSVEMKWKVFGGKHHDIYLALLTDRCKKDGESLDDENLYQQFRFHLNRGINMLTLDKELKGADGLLKMALGVI
ncbi:DNA sulfur modification protein DndE [Desulfopila inferna]|uniref:DNA sulfur modification protein DndE n=1 Tax=Desulfopila inferna TaxID=468528 RepID=UPI0019662928|nr:DNA sulfur modification protein DndE [Desulfopila inferna]MBM9606732.1 DNA sulfur modification protein DndE [Desulfopila inferna]